MRIVALHFRSRHWLVRRIQAGLTTCGLRFVPEFSGRSAIYRLAIHLRERGGSPVALLPDYICNVVHTSLERAGYSLRTYRTDEYFEPDMQEVLKHLASGDVGILVVANIFGSSALLDKLDTPPLREVLIASGVHVMLDLCQDISLVREVPTSLNGQVSIVVSFNDKSFIGVMGGGLLVASALTESRSAVSWRHQLQLYRMLWRKVLASRERSGSNRVRRHGDSVTDSVRDDYDYSYCQSFPYTCCLFKPTKVQLVLAVIGLADLPTLLERRRTFVSTCPSVLKTRYYFSAPFLVCSDRGVTAQRRRKKPYAIHGRPNACERPDINIIHNKGFADEA